MASTINASSTANGIVSTADASGILNIQSNGVNTNAQAWARATWNGSTLTVNNSYNMSSVTRTATNSFTFSMTNALADANYAVIGNCVFSSTYNGAEFIPSSSAGTWTSTTFYVVTTTAQGVGSDPAGLSVMVLR